mmetsp:Transcript_16950/g.30446  ORF Transcript_16950/g.30446 Transcript_16950/m.30446 type:complete len:715 (+) Transcript_16950:1698-3842(+)
MIRVPECSICSFKYDTVQRRPLQLSCRHTYCKLCVMQTFELMGGIMTCPECSSQTTSRHFGETINYDLLRLVEEAEIKCDMCRQASAAVCKSCVMFMCEACIGVHGCELGLILELHPLNLQKYLVNLINRERALKLEAGTKLEEHGQSCASLLAIYRNELDLCRPETIVCASHRPLKATSIRLDDFSIICKACAHYPDCLPIDEHCIPMLRYLTSVKLAGFDSFGFTPLLLRLMQSQLVGDLLKLAKHLAPGVFIPYCSNCLSRLSNSNAVKLPCLKAHLVCKNCVGTGSYTVCKCDQSICSTSQCKEVNIQLLLTSVPLCPFCSIHKDLKMLPCLHSFCASCLPKLPRCPMCFTNLKGIDKAALPDDDFIDKLTNLQCYNRDGEATKITKHTCKMLCDKCSSSRNTIYTCEALPSFIPPFLHTKVSLLLREICNLQFADLEPALEVDALSRYFQHKSATPELMGLLMRYLNLSLQEQADLLYYLKTDCTNCDTGGFEHTSGWRIPVVAYSDMHVAMRFSDLLPPQFSCSMDDPNRSFWLVDTDNNQIEILGFDCSQSIYLYGVVLAAGAEAQGHELEYFEVYSTQFHDGLGGAAAFTVNDALLFRHDRKTPLCLPQRTMTVRFDEPFSLESGFQYLMKFKLAGKRFYRGNPYTVEDPQFVIGPDLTTFRFVQALCMTDDIVNGSNEETGPLLGLIYTSGKESKGSQVQQACVF